MSFNVSNLIKFIFYQMQFFLGRIYNFAFSFLSKMCTLISQSQSFLCFHHYTQRDSLSQEDHFPAPYFGFEIYMSNFYDKNIPLLLANEAPFPSWFLDLPTMPRPISFFSFDPLKRFHW